MGQVVVVDALSTSRAFSTLSTLSSRLPCQGLWLLPGLSVLCYQSSTRSLPCGNLNRGGISGSKEVSGNSWSFSKLQMRPTCTKLANLALKYYSHFKVSQAIPIIPYNLFKY